MKTLDLDISKDIYADTDNFSYITKSKKSKESQGDWYSCRDSLQYDLYANPDCSRGSCRQSRCKFLFYRMVDNEDITNICRFFNEFYRKSKLPRKFRLKIYKTKLPDVIAFRLNAFWRSKVRFSLLTALIRSGKYFKKDFFRSLNRDYFYGNTDKALTRFMEGNYYIRYSQKDQYDHYGYFYTFTGWCDYFGKANNSNSLVSKKTIRASIRKRK